MKEHLQMIIQASLVKRAIFKSIKYKLEIDDNIIQDLKDKGRISKEQKYIFLKDKDFKRIFRLISFLYKKKNKYSVHIQNFFFVEIYNYDEILKGK